MSDQEITHKGGLYYLYLDDQSARVDTLHVPEGDTFHDGLAKHFAGINMPIGRIILVDNRKSFSKWKFTEDGWRCIQSDITKFKITRQESDGTLVLTG